MYRTTHFSAGGVVGVSLYSKTVQSAIVKFLCRLFSSLGHTAAATFFRAYYGRERLTSRTPSTDRLKPSCEYLHIQLPSISRLLRGRSSDRDAYRLTCFAYAGICPAEMYASPFWHLSARSCSWTPDKRQGQIVPSSVIARLSVASSDRRPARTHYAAIICAHSHASYTKVAVSCIAGTAGLIPHPGAISCFIGALPPSGQEAFRLAVIAQAFLSQRRARIAMRKKHGQHFADIFEILEKDPDGKRFDKGSCQSYSSSDLCARACT